MEFNPCPKIIYENHINFVKHIHANQNDHFHKIILRIKRKCPMYCFKSTITCTQYPKFSVCGKQRVLPRPYSKSKPGNDGYKIIWTAWMQEFLKEVELHVLHYLHNFREDHTLKKITLFNIEMVRKLVPACPRLGDSFFTHMTVFDTLNKEDGSIPIHFDERDLISCVFHLGSVHKDGETSYYEGDRSDNPGQPVHQVSFTHGNLQVSFFNRVLHGV